MVFILFPGNETILSWIGQCQDSDVIEDITEDMLEKLIANTDMIAVFFYNKKEKGEYEDQLEEKLKDRSAKSSGHVETKYSSLVSFAKKPDDVGFCKAL